VVPFTSFSEYEVQPDGSRVPAWFALDEDRPLAVVACICTRWTSVRKVKEGETTNDLFGFLTRSRMPRLRPSTRKPCRSSYGRRKRLMFG
jgi:putative SOS response-associated peptidase YedK